MLEPSVEILDDLVRARPLLGRYDQVDVAATARVQRMVGDTGRVNPRPRSWSRHATAVP
jgi:hypothetical protein